MLGKQNSLEMWNNFRYKEWSALAVLEQLRMAQVDESFIIVSLVYRLKIVTIEFISFHEMIDHNPALFCVSEQVLLFHWSVATRVSFSHYRLSSKYKINVLIKISRFVISVEWFKIPREISIIEREVTPLITDAFYEWDQKSWQKIYNKGLLFFTVLH